MGGTLHNRTAFAGATTGQQLLYALDEQTRRYEAEEKVTKYENWEFLSLVLDNSRRCRGIIAINRSTLEVVSFRADAVILCTGGPGGIFGRSTMSGICTGSAVSAAYQQGVYYANGEFIQVHPTAIAGEDKNRLISESVRGEGGRVWVYKDGKPWYFLEDWYPKYGNLVPRDVATRAIFKIVYEEKLGIDGKPQVYLDVSHLDPKMLEEKLGGVLEIYEKFVGDDPKKIPMRVFPSMHYSMGGLWVDFNQMTNVEGLFAAGECEYQYHGANRLGANSLLSCIHGGMVAGPNALAYAQGLEKSSTDIEASYYNDEVVRQQEANDKWIRAEGNENLHQIHKELGEWMTENVTVIRVNENLRKTDEKIQELMERMQRACLDDTGGWANEELLFARQFENMLPLARVITIGAFRRNESRGGHYKPEFPERDDEQWLKTTKVRYKEGEPEFSYEDVDIQHIKPRKRSYESS